MDEYETLLQTLAAVLTRFGYTVLLARNPGEARSVAGRHPDVVLLDFRQCPRCPGGPGECLAEEFRTLNPEAKILVWCADGLCLQQPPPCAHATFMKPVSPAELAAVLDSVIAGRPIPGSANH